jgi:hypothetical protein
MDFLKWLWKTSKGVNLVTFALKRESNRGEIFPHFILLRGTSIVDFFCRSPIDNQVTRINSQYPCSNAGERSGSAACLRPAFSNTISIKNLVLKNKLVLFF